MSVLEEKKTGTGTPNPIIPNLRNPRQTPRPQPQTRSPLFSLQKATREIHSRPAQTFNATKPTPGPARATSKQTGKQAAYQRIKVDMARLRRVISSLHASRTAMTMAAPSCNQTQRAGIKEAKAARAAEISKLSEVVAMDEFARRLSMGWAGIEVPPVVNERTVQSVGLEASDYEIMLDAGMATMMLHTEARICSLLGEAFYTIGPCGEENMAAVGLALRSDDPAALHYRHTAVAVLRQLRAGRPLAEVALDRARGYTTSVNDPVTGGRHCAIGGGAADFIVTSTLASQSSPAVGRALGSRLAKRLGVPPTSAVGHESVSFVSVGDGSINNGHFLSATNLAAYAQHRAFKCPVVFAVSDNDRCISLPGYGYARARLDNLGLTVFRGDGACPLDTYATASQAIAYARQRSRPVIMHLTGLPRRHGHAATDRQDAYMTVEDIRSQASRDPLLSACAVAVRDGILSWPAVAERFERISETIAEAFDLAAAEPKLGATTRAEVASSNAQPLAAPPARQRADTESSASSEQSRKPLREVMRKHMNRALHEQLGRNGKVVYIGEDVTHGGYYRVTDRLADAFRGRVVDFPPDETAIMGVGVGYAQCGLVPIVEMPYAKYLDCAADMFNEAVIANWLTNGRGPNGMLVRLQGFDKGVFGGNFHTHNTLAIPPGLDVVCYSGGADWVRGFRYCIRQAEAGRMVMVVDSTNLLNARHVVGRDNALMSYYPEDPNDELPFDHVTLHGPSTGAVAVVTYGNGVVSALQAQQQLSADSAIETTVIDHPYLSGATDTLRAALEGFDAVVFADVCKAAQPPLAGFVTELQREGRLPTRWQLVAAPNTYNPLGTTLTFLSAEDVAGAVRSLTSSS